MPVVYRVSNTNPKTVKANNGFVGNQTSALPPHPTGGTWPAGGFCAATLAGNLTAKEMKTALTRFRPPPATGDPYLYRFTVQPNEMIEVKEIPAQYFTNFTHGSGGEVIVTVPILAAAIDVAVGGSWINVSSIP